MMMSRSWRLGTLDRDLRFMSGAAGRSTRWTDGRNLLA
jgi:hypothetical protein